MSVANRKKLSVVSEQEENTDIASAILLLAKSTDTGLTVLTRSYGSEIRPKRLIIKS